jgi:GxxExxY protein
MLEKETYKHNSITNEIIGASFDVHSFLGNGFQEVIYQRALAYELSKRNLKYAREIDQYIYYKDLVEPIGTRRADFIVEGKVLVELKAIEKIDNLHYAQILNYLKVYKIEVGLLINFGSKSLTFKRFVI